MAIEGVVVNDICLTEIQLLQFDIITSAEIAFDKKSTITMNIFRIIILIIQICLLGKHNDELSVKKKKTKKKKKKSTFKIKILIFKNIQSVINQENKRGTKMNNKRSTTKYIFTMK